MLVEFRPVPQLERSTRAGKIFCMWGHKFVPFRSTRIACLNQQVATDLKKKGHRAILAYFSWSFL